LGFLGVLGPWEGSRGGPRGVVLHQPLAAGPRGTRRGSRRALATPVPKGTGVSPRRGCRGPPPGRSVAEARCPRRLSRRSLSRKVRYMSEDYNQKPKNKREILPDNTSNPLTLPCGQPRPGHAVRYSRPCTGRGWDPRETREGSPDPGARGGPSGPPRYPGSTGSPGGRSGPLRGPEPRKSPKRGYFPQKRPKMAFLGYPRGNPVFRPFSGYGGSSARG